MLISVEQVSKYHPDKYADQISDGIVGWAVSKNPNARVAVETLVKGTQVIVAGEIAGVHMHYGEVSEVIKSVAKSLNYKVTSITNLIGGQSGEISQAVDGMEQTVRAGDQGMMVGYATNETSSGLPRGMHIANQIIDILEFHTLAGGILVGDAKTQVTYDDVSGIIERVVVSVCYNEGFSLEGVTLYIKTLLGSVLDTAKLTVNPAGPWLYGGPNADAGVTGRKIVADQYGPTIPVGGGAFSGKDLSKVDRSGAYVARNIALDVLKTFDIKSVTLQLAYVIGEADPVSVNVKTGINKETDEIIKVWIQRFYDLSVPSLIKRLALKPEDYLKLAAGCHYKNKYVGDWL